MAITVLFASSKSTSAVAKGDEPIRDRLETTLGHTMSYTDVDGTPNGSDTTSAAELATAATSASADMVFLPSSTVIDSIRTDIFAGLAVPAITTEGWLWDEHSFAATGKAGETSTTHTAIDVVTPSHPAAGALTGTVTVLDVPARMNYVSAGSMPAGATAIATVAGDADKVVAWVIETGDELADGRSAPARRAGFLFVYDSAAHATSDCWTMFDAAVGWVANESSAVTPSATYTGSDPTAGGTAAVGKYTGRMWAIGDTGQLPELEVSAAFGVPWNEEPSEGVGIDRFEFDGLYTYDQDSAAIVVCPFGDQTPFFAFDGTVGGYVSTPDTAANSITGDLDVAVRVSFDDVTPAANESLVGEWSTAPNLAYLLAIHTSGALRLYTSTTGSDSVTGTSTATLGSVTSAGTAVWVRATYDASTGDKEFFYSLDDVEVESAVSWTQLGATVSGTSGAIPDTTSDLMVGAHGGGGSWNLAGEIYVAEVYDDDGIVERIAAADATVGASTFVSSISAATVTIAGTAALDSDPPEVNYGTGDTLAVTGGTGHSLVDGPRPGQQATLFAGGVSGVGEDTMDIDNPGHTGGFTLAFSSSMALTGTGTGTRYYASYTAGGTGWSLFTYQNGNVYFKTVDGGGSYNHIWTAALALDGTWEHVALVYDGATTASLYVDGVLVAAKTVTAPVDNAGTVDLSVGKAWVSGGASRVMDMTLAEYLFTSDELSAAQIGELAATALSRGHWLSVADLDWPNSFDVTARVQVDEWPNQPAALLEQWDDGGLATSDVITFVSTSESTDKMGATVTIPAPAGLADDDLMVMWGHGDRAPSAGWGAPAGWTEVVTHEAVTGRSRGSACFYRVAASESGSYAFTFDASQERWGCITVFRNVDTSSPLDVTYTSAYLAESVSNNTPSQPPITTVTDGAVVLIMSGMSEDDITSPAAPAGYTLAAEFYGTGAYDDARQRQGFVAHKTVTTAGLEAPADWAHADNGTEIADSTQVTIAIRPASAGTAGQRAVRWTIDETGMRLQVSTDGDTVALDESIDAADLPAYYTDDSEPFSVRVIYLSVVSSAAVYWLARQADTDSWVILQSDVHPAPAVPFASSAPLTVGGSTLAGIAILAAGVGQPLVDTAVWSATDLTVGATSFVDGQGNVWTQHGGLLMTAGDDWTDITADVRHANGAHTERGRSLTIGETQPGAGSVTLDNRDRRYDPTYTDGDNWPHIRPMTHMRIRATWGGRTVGLFRGFARRWDPQYPGVGHDAVTHVELADASIIAARTIIDGGYLHPNIADIPGALHFPLDERAGVDYGRETLTPYPDGVYLAEHTQAAATFHTDGSSHQYIHHDIAEGLAPIMTTVGLDGELTVACWIRDTATSGDMYPVTIRDASSADILLTLTVELDGGITVLWHDDGAGSTVTLVATSDLMDGDWHYLTVTRAGSGTSWVCSAYVDGVQIADDVTGPVETPGTSDDVFSVGHNLIGNIGEMSLAPVALSDVAALETYEAWTDTLPLQTPDERIRRVLAGYIDLPGTPNLDLGAAAMTEETPTGSTVAEVLRTAALTEMGMLFWAGDGTATFHARSRRRADNPTVEIGAGTDVPIVDIRYSDGVDTRRNSVVVTYDGGTVSAVDTTAVARDGEIRETVTLPVASESYAQAWADHVVGTRANQTTRVDTVTISAGRDPDNIVRTVLELEIGDRVTVYHTPVDDTGTPDVIEFTGFVERMSWDLGGDRWWLTLTLSPEAFSLADW